MKDTVVIFLCLTLSLSASSQNFDDIEFLLLASKEDQNLIFKEYFGPVVRSINYGMASGWYNTAKTHKKLGFDITLSLNSSFIPTSAETYSTSGLTSISSSSEQLPTVLGGSTNETMSISLFGQGSVPELNASFIAPSGIKDDLPLSIIATPSVQIALGLPYKTDLIVRYIPVRSNKNTSVGLKGIGIKHNLLQHFGPADKIPLIDLSLLAAYSTYSIDYNIQKTSNLDGANQQALISMDSYVIKLISSIDIKLLNLYAGLGYSRSISDLKILGSYNLPYTIADTSEQIIVNVSDPLIVNWDKESISGNAGISFKLPGIKIFADYTVQKYNSVSVGISLSVR